MNELWALMSTPAFWIGSFFMGIVGNVIAAPITRGLGSVLGKFNESWERRNAKASEQFEKTMYELFESADQYHSLQNRLLLSYARAIFLFVASTGILLVVHTATGTTINSQYATLFCGCLMLIAVGNAVTTGSKETMLRAVDKLHAKFEKHQVEEALKKKDGA